jgi:hypothetical protein
MMTVFIVIAAYFPLVWMDTRKLYHRKNKTDFYGNASLYLVSFVMAILLALHVDIPGPSLFIKNVVDSLLQMFH